MRLNFTRLATRRFYSTATPPSKPHWSSHLDKSQLYPAVLLVLFGSQVINLMTVQRDHEELERRYTLKIGKLEDIISRIETGERVDVESEMKLIQKMFDRPKEFKMKLGKVEHTDKVTSLKEDDDFMKLLGLEEVSKPERTHGVGKNAVITDSEDIKQQTAIQKDLISFKVTPETHVIVSTPGDYIDAAKDTKLSKFL